MTEPPVAHDDTPTRLLDFKYAIALIEGRIPLEGPANREPLRQRVERLKSYAKPSEVEAELRAEVEALWRAAAPDCFSREDREMWTHELMVREIRQLRADSEEVSRLREALNEKKELLKQIMRTVHVGTFQAAAVAVEGLGESVSRLQQENALLRRSLEMLTKQLDEKDERIDELVGLVGEHD